MAAFSTVVGAVSREQDTFQPEGHARRVVALLVKKQEVEMELRAYRALMRKQGVLRVLVSAAFDSVGVEACFLTRLCAGYIDRLSCWAHSCLCSRRCRARMRF